MPDIYDMAYYKDTERNQPPPPPPDSQGTGIKWGFNYEYFVIVV